MKRKLLPPMGILLFLCLTFMLVPVNAQTADETIVLAPDTAAEVSMSAEQLSAYDRRALILRKLEKQEDYTEMMGSMESAEPAPPGLPPVLGRPVGIGGAADISEISGMDVVNPQLLIIGRNNKNTRANSTLGNNLAEPAAANNARLVFGMGNTHSEYSTDGGVTWTNVAIPAGPSGPQFHAVTLTLLSMMRGVLPSTVSFTQMPIRQMVSFVSSSGRILIPQIRAPIQSTREVQQTISCLIILIWG